MDRLAAGIFCARIPWGVFLAAAGLSYLLLAFVFRGDARHSASDFVSARVEYGGRTVTLRLLRDTGNCLTDPLTGEGVPVIEKNALAPLWEKGNRGSAAYRSFTSLRIGTVSGAGTLPAFRCDALTVGDRPLGARLIAVAPGPLGGAYQGLWYGEDEEGSAEDELEADIG